MWLLNSLLMGSLAYWAGVRMQKKDPRKEEIRLLTAYVEKCAGGIDHWAMVEKSAQWVLSQKGFEKLSPAEVDALTYRHIREGYEGELRAAEARLKPLVEEVAAEEAKAKAEREKRAEEDARYAADTDRDEGGDDDISSKYTVRDAEVTHKLHAEMAKIVSPEPGSADDDVDGGDEAEKARAEQIRELTRECEFLRKADRLLTAERNAAHATIARQIEEIRALTASRESFQREVARGAGIIERRAKQVRDLTAERDALRESDVTGNRLLTKADRDIAALKTERDTLLVERGVLTNDRDTALTAWEEIIRKAQSDLHLAQTELTLTRDALDVENSRRVEHEQISEIRLKALREKDKEIIALQDGSAHQLLRNKNTELVRENEDLKKNFDITVDNFKAEAERLAGNERVARTRIESLERQIEAMAVEHRRAVCALPSRDVITKAFLLELRGAVKEHLAEFASIFSTFSMKEIDRDRGLVAKFGTMFERVMVEFDKRGARS